MGDVGGILIVGGGVTGLAAALALSAVADADVTLVDRGSPPTFDRDRDVGVRVSAISLGSVRLLDDLGVWAQVRSERTSRYRAMRVWDSQSHAEGPDALVFDAADFALSELGFIVENELIRYVLHRRCVDSQVRLLYDSSLATVCPRADGTGFGIELQSGETFVPELLVGADGGASLVRRNVGIGTTAWRYPQSALVTHVSPERDHRQTAWQRFLPGGPMALLPLADGRCSVVWSAAPDQVVAGLSASTDALGGMLTEASGGVLGTLRVEGARASFALGAQHADRYVAAGIALIGDAAHSVHPLAGQGANLGLADVQALRATLRHARGLGERPGDLPTLRRYERARRGANAGMLYFIDGIHRLFASKSPPLTGLRRSGMRLFNRSGPLRRRAVQVALGINV